MNESFLQKFFHFYRFDPLFTGPAHSKYVNKREYIIPIGYKQTTRINQAIEYLGFVPVKPPIIQKSAQLSEVRLTSSEIVNTETSQLFSTEIPLSTTDSRKETQEIIRSLLVDMIELEVQLNIENFVKESFKEIIAASLTLYSSSVLDRVITEVLSELIPTIAKQSHTEVTDSEYIDIRNLIIFETLNEEIELISRNQTNTILSLNISEEVIGQIQLYKIALQTIEEENKENLSIVFIVADKLLDEFFNQE